MARELKKTCDDYIVEALELLNEMASTRQEIGDFQHVREMHPTEWQKWIIEETAPEEYLNGEHGLMDSLHKRLAIAITGIHGTCVSRSDLLRRD